MTTYSTPFPYYGAKTIYLNVLLGKFPPHKVYVECFGGSATVLINKSPSPCEVYNDIDGELVNFFRVLRNPTLTRELQEELYLTPYSREEYEKSWEILNEIGDRDKYTEVERARMWFIICRQSFSSDLTSSHWSFSKTTPRTGAWYNAIDRLKTFTHRLQQVQIEHCSFEKLFERYDGIDTLFYCDPPYVESTRVAKKAYRNELNGYQHKHLLELTTKCKGKVIISGYPTQLYDRVLVEQNAWLKIEIKTKAYAAKGAKGDRVEVLWIKPNAITGSSLWDGISSYTEFTEEYEVE